MSAELVVVVPITVDGSALVTRSANRRAMTDGSASNPPMVQAMVSTSVRFTWCTVAGDRSA
jgi:hypothetical protein